MIGEDAILVYKNKKYVVHGNDIKNIKKAKLYEYKGDTSFMKDPFYDLELLKRVINYCELTSINVVKVNCKFNMSDYIKEYNDLYNKKIETTYDNKISMDIVYYEDNIGKFIIDYTDINKAINKNDNTVKYGVKIVSVGENDFTSLFDFFKKYLTK